MAEKVTDKKPKNPTGKTEDYRGQKPAEKGTYTDTQKKGNDPKKKW